MSPPLDSPVRSGSRPLVVASAVLLILATLTGLYTVWDGLVHLRAADDDRQLVALLDRDETVLEELAAEIYGRTAQIASTSTLEDATNRDLTLLAEQALTIADVPQADDPDQSRRLRQVLADPAAALSQARTTPVDSDLADPTIPNLILLQSDVMAVARLYGSLFSDPVLTAHAARLSSSGPPPAVAADPTRDQSRHDSITALTTAATSLHTQAMARLVASSLATVAAAVAATVLIVIALRRRPVRASDLGPAAPVTKPAFITPPYAKPPEQPSPADQDLSRDPKHSQTPGPRREGLGTDAPAPLLPAAHQPTPGPDREPWASRLKPSLDGVAVPPPPQPPELLSPTQSIDPSGPSFDTDFAPLVASPDQATPPRTPQPSVGLAPFASPVHPDTGPNSQPVVQPVIAPDGVISTQRFYPPSSPVKVVEPSVGRPVRPPADPATSLSAEISTSTAASAYAAVKVSAALRQAALKTTQPRRIWVTLGVDPVIAGSYVGAVTEIMAELLTNAINYSPAAARVELTTAVVPGGIRVDIADLGPGLPQDHTAAYNQALASPAGLATLPSSGLARVGRLVHQLGGRVALTGQGSNAGLLAAVALPDALFHWPTHKSPS